MAFLVGGFGANDWLWSQLEVYFKSQGIELSRPSKVYVRVRLTSVVLLTGHSHKAVPDGALSFLIDHLVNTRVARATYGTTCSNIVDETDPEHLARRESWFTNAAGAYGIPCAFRGILHKVCFCPFSE